LQKHVAAFDNRVRKIFLELQKAGDKLREENAWYAKQLHDCRVELGVESVGEQEKLQTEPALPVLSRNETEYTRFPPFESASSNSSGGDRPAGYISDPKTPASESMSEMLAYVDTLEKLTMTESSPNAQTDSLKTQEEPDTEAAEEGEVEEIQSMINIDKGKGREDEHGMKWAEV